MTIIEGAPLDSPLHSILPRLGGFHNLISFLGSIGHLMSGTGLQELLEVIFTGNTVPHIISGKAYARAVRGHFLIDAVLHTLLLSKVCGTKLILPCQDSDKANVDSLLSGISDLFDDLMSGTVTIEDVESSEMIKSLQVRLKSVTDTAESESSTSKLWLMYMQMIDIIRDFIRSERAGNWQLHLSTMREILPFMAASGQYLYTKSLYIYLQKMTKLPETHPQVHGLFLKGFHVIRQSERFWAGLSQDLVIEQVPMRNLKTSGGLTHGRGMTKVQRVLWCLSRPACAEISDTMQQLTSVTLRTSEQHKDSSVARQKRDAADSEELLSFLEWRSPFDALPALQNIVTGISAGAQVNVQHAKDIGEAVLNGMTGKGVLQHSFKRKDQAVTFSSKASVKIGDDTAQIDSLLLFQRLVIDGSQENDLANVLCYELCSFPPALFESKDMLLEADKPNLAAAIWSAMPSKDPPEHNFKYVLDGGALVQRIPWQVGDTYDKILKSYIGYVTKHYGQPVVVFDDYSDGPSTKDCTHLRQGGGVEGRKIRFTANMTLQLKKKEFLSNREHKQRLIALLGERLSECGCDVLYASGDADLMIVQTAVKVSTTCEVVLAGDDTDLLVLLVNLARDERNNIFFRPEPKKGAIMKCLSVKTTRVTLGLDVCDNILFVHALLGCDTTSRLFGIGKGTGLKLIKDNKVFRQAADIFQSSESSKAEIKKAGEKAMLIVYRGKETDSLDTLRHQRFQELVTISKKAVRSDMLPPTSAAETYHSLRVFHQVQYWKGNSLDTDEWGWKVYDGRMVPIITDKDPAPQSLLKRVRCTCKSGCRTMRCGRRQQGLDCSMACSGCRGVCDNVPSDANVDDIEM